MVFLQFTTVFTRELFDPPGGSLRKFLYSKWFFGFLAAVCTLDLLADVSELVAGWEAMNYVAIPLDLVAVFLTVWMFVDLYRRSPKNGGDPGS